MRLGGIAATLLAVLVVVAAAAAGVGSAGAREAAVSLHCKPPGKRAVVAGHRRCLRLGDSCRARFDRDYHRVGLDCAGGFLSYWWGGLERRPLRIPTLAAGSACPAAAPDGSLGDHGSTDARSSPAFGPGPAYPTLAVEVGRALLDYLPSWGYDGWDGTKLLWTIPRYRGPLIVRGRQLDGPGVLRFDQGPQWSDKLHPDLRLVGPETTLHPAATFLRRPGCYGYQVDGYGFSYVIVFAARPASP